MANFDPKLSKFSNKPAKTELECYLLEVEATGLLSTWISLFWKLDKDLLNYGLNSEIFGENSEICQVFKYLFVEKSIWQVK